MNTIEDERRKFPGIFPDNCPPKEAHEEEIVVYRFINGQFPSEADFKSYIEEGKSFTPNENYPFIEYGLSFYKSYSEIKSKWNGSIFLKKKRKIAYGVTYKWAGLIQHTPMPSIQSHATWWLYGDMRPWLFFDVADDNNVVRSSVNGE